MIWLTSDTHLFHENIIKYCNRPFSSVEEMNRVIIENWNNIVKEDDIVYHLGDVVLARKNFLVEAVSKLKGQKYLIRGNHDKDITDSKFKEAGFIEVYKNPLPMLEYGIILSHAPIVSESGLFNVHGHTHNSDPSPKYLFYRNNTHRCISQEMTDYKPISLESILREKENGKEN